MTKQRKQYSNEFKLEMVKLIEEQNQRVVDVVNGFYNDTYNFEMHNSLMPDKLLRNANTKIGSPTFGSLSGCIGFNISFNKTNYNRKNIIGIID